MRFNLTTRSCPAIAILLATWTSSCLKGPGFLKQGETEALTSLIQTTEEAGDVTGSYSAASSRYQTILASSSSAVSGASVIFPPGSLSFSTSIILGEGSDAASADVLAQLGLDSSAVSGVGSSLYVAASDATDLIVPMSLSLPLFSSSSLFLDADTSRYAVAYVGIKLETKETSVGLIPNKEITFKDGNATFETSTWGSYRLVQISDEVEKPVERVVKPTAEAPPRRNNEVKDLPKMLVTGRSPFVVMPVGKFTVTGENLIGMRAFIKDRKLTLKESSDGKSIEIQLPTTEELIATTSSATTRGRGRGMFVIGLGQDGSPGTDTNIMILDTKPTANAFSLNSEAICARQDFIAGDGTTRDGTGTRNCTGRLPNDASCNPNLNTGCRVDDTGTFKAALSNRLVPCNIKRGINIGGVTGNFPGSVQGNLPECKLPDAGAEGIASYLGSNSIPASGSTNPAALTMNLFDAAGTPVTIDLLRVAGNDELTPGKDDIQRNRENTLYMPFQITGDANLKPENISAGKTLFSVPGTALTRSYWTGGPSTWTDGATGYTWTIASTSPTTSPNCGTGNASAALPTDQDLKWAFETGITSGPSGLLATYTYPLYVWYRQYVPPTPETAGATDNWTNKLVKFTSSTQVDPSEPPSTTEGMALCVTKPSGARGNGP